MGLFKKTKVEQKQENLQDIQKEFDVVFIEMSKYSREMYALERRLKEMKLEYIKKNKQLDRLAESHAKLRQKVEAEVSKTIEQGKPDEEPSK